MGPFTTPGLAVAAPWSVRRIPLPLDLIERGEDAERKYLQAVAEEAMAREEAREAVSEGHAPEGKPTRGRRRTPPAD